MVMEDIDGRPLSERLAEGPLPVADALSVAIKLVEALEALHRRGVIHKDLNPANILHNPRSGAVKIVDFGLATVLDRESQPVTAGPTTPRDRRETKTPTWPEGTATSW